MSDPKDTYGQYPWQPLADDDDDVALDPAIPEFLTRQMPIERAPTNPLVGVVRAMATGALLGAAALVPSPAVLPQATQGQRRTERAATDGDDPNGTPQPARPELTPAERAALDADLEIPAFRRNR